MNRREPAQDPEGEPQAPPRLVAALKEVHNQHVFVPPTVDQAILARARENLPQARPEQHHFHWAALSRWAALAACGVLLLGLALMNLHSKRTEPAFAREDINHDGTVDVLDAMVLSQKIQSGARGSPDINGDGVIDQRDAAAIAQHAVKLEKGGRS